MRALLCAAALAAVGCGAGAGDGDSTSLVTNAPAVSAPEPVEPMARKSLTLSPDALSEAWATEAVSAWAEAADVALAAPGDGIPVRARPRAEMWTPCVIDGVAQSCLPNAKWDGDEISVRIDGDCPARSLAHEIGHALGLPHLPAPSLMQSPSAPGCEPWSVGADVLAQLGLETAE